MRDRSEIRTALAHVFEAECSVVGQDVVDEMLDGSVIVDQSADGKKLDLVTTLAVIGDGAALVAALLMTYDMFFLRNSRAPTKDELREALFASLSEEERDKLLSQALAERSKARNEP